MKTSAGREGWAGLDAGRELDAIVAEKVMGWGRDGARLWPPGVKRSKWPHGISAPAYSTDISAAWDAVRAMSRHGFLFRGEVYTDGARADFVYYERPADEVPDGVAVVDPREVSDEATPEDAMPLAICRAALAALSHEQQSVDRSSDELEKEEG